MDSARLSGAKNSPMMEGIEHCVNQIDDNVMQELSPRIINIIKKGTGLPTKVSEKSSGVQNLSIDIVCYRLDVLALL